MCDIKKFNLDLKLISYIDFQVVLNKIKLLTSHLKKLIEYS